MGRGAQGGGRGDLIMLEIIYVRSSSIIMKRTMSAANVYQLMYTTTWKLMQSMASDSHSGVGAPLLCRVTT